MGGKRGQISAEYLIVVGFVTFLVITILGVALFYTSSIQDRLKSNQLENFANKVISNAEVVYFSGSPSKATISAYLPSGIQDIREQDDYLIFDISTSTGTNTISFKSNVPISASFANKNEGLKRLTLEIVGESVQITDG